MQTGSGRGGRATLPGIDRLVSLAVLLLVLCRAMDIGRQRDLSQRVERGKEVRDRLELQGAFAELTRVNNVRHQPSRACRRFKHKLLAHRHLAPWLDQRAPAVVAQRLRQQHLHHTAGRGRAFLRVQPCASPMQPSGYHAAVVHHQQVAGPQQRGKVTKPSIAVLARLPIHGEHARAIALCRWALCDQLRRQHKIKILNTHGLDCT